MMVGSYEVFGKPGYRVRKGEIHGEFRFGGSFSPNFNHSLIFWLGSTVLIMFEPNKVEFDRDLLANSSEGEIGIGLTLFSVFVNTFTFIVLRDSSQSSFSNWKMSPPSRKRRVLLNFCVIKLFELLFYQKSSILQIYGTSPKRETCLTNFQFFLSELTIFIKFIIVLSLQLPT